MLVGKLTRLRTWNPGIGMHSTSSMSRTQGCTFLHGSPVNLQDLPDARSWSTVLAQKQDKYTREDPSNENKQTNKLKPNKMSSCFTSSFPRPSPSYKSRSTTLPGILRFFWFLLSMRGIPEQFSWHGLTSYPLFDLLWNCFGMIHFL